MSFPDVYVFAFAFVVIFIAQFVKGFSGFASALVALPFLVLVFDIKFALAFFIISDILASTIMCAKELKSMDLKMVGITSAGLLLGAGIGGYIISFVDSESLTKAFGYVVLAMAAHIFLKRNEKVARAFSQIWSVFAGLFAGLCGVLFGANGPIVVYFCSHALTDSRKLRASLYGIFFLDLIFRMGAYTLTGLMTYDVILLGLSLVPAMAAGLYLGNKTFFKVDEAKFKTIITAIIMVTGAMIILR